MAFYADFSGHYEKIFPLREPTFRFLDHWLSNERRLLDLGCGTGHYCGRLAETGRDCLGIDLDPGMVGQAEKNYADPAFRIMDLQAVCGLKKASFGGVYCIGNVLPHLPARHLPAFLSSVRKLLEPGGRWIFQTVNFDPLLHLEEYEFPALTFPEDGLTFHRKYANIFDGSLLFQTSLRQGENELFAGETPLYPYSSKEYLAMNREAGFNLLGHFADFSGQAFVPEKFSGSVYVWEATE